MKRSAIVLAGLSLASVSTPKGSVADIDYGPQVVLKVDHSENGTMLVVPQAKVWFRIGATSSDIHPAPLPDGTLMLCKAFTFRSTEGAHIGLQCGLDTYLIRNVGMKP